MRAVRMTSTAPNLEAVNESGRQRQRDKPAGALSSRRPDGRSETLDPRPCGNSLICELLYASVTARSHAAADRVDTRSLHSTRQPDTEVVEDPQPLLSGGRVVDATDTRGSFEVFLC